MNTSSGQSASVCTANAVTLALWLNLSLAKAAKAGPLNKEQKRLKAALVAFLTFEGEA